MVGSGGVGLSCGGMRVVIVDQIDALRGAAGHAVADRLRQAYRPIPVPPVYSDAC